MAVQAWLDDLDGLDDGEEEEDHPHHADVDPAAAGKADTDAGADASMEPAVGRAAPRGLLHSERLTSLLQTIEEHMAVDAPAPSEAAGGSLQEGHPEYALIVACNETQVDVDAEIEVLVREVRQSYAKRFPELESLVVAPVDYARVVLRIGDADDLTAVDLERIVPAATVMVVTVTASTTSGKPLHSNELGKVLDSAQQVVDLADAKRRMMEFVERRMDAVAPNLTAIVGADVAARLIGSAGGLAKVAGMPANVVQSLGLKRRTLGGLASGGQLAHTGHLMGCTLLQGTPPALRAKMVRLIAGRCTLAARVDSFRRPATGARATGEEGVAAARATGEKFREEILGKLDKWQEPAPFKQPKPLPVPEAKTMKKRGGARARRLKERTQMTEMRAQTNRVHFGVAEETFGLDEEGIGTLGQQQATGKVRLAASKQKMAHLGKKVQEQAQKGVSSGATGGLTSTLAFTPVQGIELVNPQAKEETNEGTETYFSRAASFFSHDKAPRTQG